MKALNKRCNRGGSIPQLDIQDIFDNAPIGIFASVPDGRFIFANTALAGMFGYSSPETMIEAISDIATQVYVDPTAREKFKRLVAEQERLTHYEVRLRRRDGTEFYGTINARAILDLDGCVTAYQGFITDITKQKQSEESLRESEAKLRSYVDDAPYGIFIANREGHYVYVNPAACKISGYSRDELLDMSIPDLFAADSREAGERHFSVLLASGCSDGEFGFVRKGGEVRQWRVLAKALRPDRFLGFVEDVTERGRIEDELQHSHRLLKYIIEHARCAVAVHDKELKYIYVSQRYLDDYNIKDKNIIGKHHYDVFPDLPQKWRDVHQKVLCGAVLSADDDPYEKEDGSEEWTRWECRPWYENDGSIGGIIVYTEVITERKQIEQELKESEARFKVLHNASFGGIVIHDQGLILECNQGLSEITGYTYDELIGMDGLLLISDATREMVISNIKAGYEKPYEAEGVRKDGSVYPVRLEAREIRYRGKAVRVVEFRDITEQQNLEAQLMQAQKMESIGRLAGGVAHDFNNLLMGIMGYADLCRDGLPDPHPVREWLDEITHEAERSASLTRQLLAFARRQTVAPEVVDLNDLVGNMLKMLRHLIGEDIDLVWQPGADLWSTKIDPSQLDQILANLCVNARDAINGVGKVTIETTNVSLDESYCADHVEASPGAHVMLAVSDDGCGMDHETLRNIFEPFFTTKPTGEGTGLGLATVYGIVKQNAGFVNVYSEPGKGTTFRIYLPREASARKETASESVKTDLQGGTETILLVEDEAGIRLTIRLFLERFGYTVIAAACPEEALRLVADHPDGIDLLITDVVMPGMSGRDLADKLALAYPSMKILYMSGYTANVIAHRGILDEGVQFLSKPIGRDELAQKVREVLG